MSGGAYAGTDAAFLSADELTGLGARSKLLGDLAEAVAPGSPLSPLLVFALDGHAFYSIVASGGHALLPAEASDPIEALTVADRRLSASAPKRAPRRAR